MEPKAGFLITPRAAAELCRLSLRAGQPGLAYLNLVEGSCETWALQLRGGTGSGVALARADGITLYGRREQLALLKDMQVCFPPKSMHFRSAPQHLRRPIRSQE